MKTANQDIRPVTYKINNIGNIEIGGCDLSELADKYGTPFYLFDETTIRTMTRAYKEAFKNYPEMNMMFASKAFMTSAICKIMEQEGFGLDLCSLGEMYTAKNAGFDMSKTLLNGNNKSYDELKSAIDWGVGTISVDNFLELAVLDNIAKSCNKKVKILLRITPGIECHTHEYIQTGHLDSKFGFDLTRIDSAVDLIIEEYTNLELKGLHTHIGSQIFEKQVYFDEVGVIFKEIKRIKDKYGLELNEINLGGGLGVKYTEEDNPISVYEIAETIIDSIEINSEKYKIKKPVMFIEPGRSIIATSGVTVYTVGASKQVPNGRLYVAVDGGMSDNARVSLYQAKYSVDVVNKPSLDRDKKVTIAGRFCESGDILAKDIMLPEIEAGDLLCFYDTGAYGYSMSSNYNLVLKPISLLVKDGKSDIIIDRQTLEQLVQSDKIPDRLKAGR